VSSAAQQTCVSSQQAPASDAAPVSAILPTLFGEGYGEYRPQRYRFVLSFVVHIAATVLIALSARFVVIHQQEIGRQVVSLVTDASQYVLSPSKTTAGGGGGGGDRSKLAASKGALPKLSREQITPPAIVVRNEQPKLPVPPTVVVPPDVKLPQLGPIGDPLSAVLAPPSNGTGSGSGIGSGSGGGIGSGRGPGVGPGYGGGIGGGVYRLGNGVSPPRPIYSPDPEFSEEARKAKYQGTVVLTLIVGADGRAHEIEVRRSLGMGLDEKAIEAVQRWKFEPARKDGLAVAVMVNVEVNFHLY
jgi:TonB family protein